MEGPKAAPITWALLSARARIGSGGRQEVLEPLLFLSSCAAKQVEVDRKLLFCYRLPPWSFVLLLNMSWALFPSFPISQSDADGVFLVPQSLPGQSGGQQRYLGPTGLEQDVTLPTISANPKADPKGHKSLQLSKKRQPVMVTMETAGHGYY